MPALLFTRHSTPHSWLGKPDDEPGEAPALRHFAKPSGLHVVDEPPDMALVRDERARVYARDRLTHVVVDIGERLQRERWTDACVLLDLRLHVVVREREHPAIGVVD